MLKKKNPSRNIIIVSFFTALSRIFGLIRDMMFSRVIGISFVADAFFIALRLPNIFRRITAEGAFSAAFIPIFSKKFLEDKKDSIKFSEDILYYMIIFITLLAIVSQVIMPFVIYILAGGFSQNLTKLELAVSYSRLTLPYIIFISLGSLGSAIINSKGKFFVTSLTPILLNIFLILALLIPNLEIISRGYLLSFAVSFSGIIHFLIIFSTLSKEGFSLRFRKSKKNQSINSFSRLAWPQTISGLAIQFNILISGFIASFKDGGISILYYAERLYQFPLALIGISIGTVILPHLASLNLNKQKNEVRDLLNNTLKIALVLIIPASMGLIFLSELIVSVIYEYGVFGVYEVGMVSNVLIGFSIGLPAYVLIRIFSSIFYSMSDTRNPLIYSLIAISINIFLSIPMFIYFGVVGISYATAISAWIHALIFYIRLKELSLFLPTKEFILDICKVLLISFIMGIIVSYCSDQFSLLFPIISVVILVFIGIGLYLMGLFLVGVYKKDDIKSFITDL